MKKSILIGLILVPCIMVSYVTAVPYNSNQTINKKINEIETIGQSFNTILSVGIGAGLLSIFTCLLLLIPTYIFLIIGCMFLSMPMPMKIGGAVIMLLGFAIGLISLVFLSLGLKISPELDNSLTLLITFLCPAIISILLIYLILY